VGAKNDKTSVLKRLLKAYLPLALYVLNSGARLDVFLGDYSADDKLLFLAC
jgi:hypothetical protein